ncbi:MAG TPA: hypothetical protein VKT25_00175 [Ktedonobacteraceae bacterium]|nr:hypothetical protein [Ktedonobacteraceae bacterium]
MTRWDRLRIPSLRLNTYELLAVIIIIGALGLRLFFLAVGMPEVNGDEGTMGIEAMHIAFQGQHPVFLYGQDYMGVLEAYLAAFFFHLFGVSSFTLRLGMALMFLLFLVSMYCLTSLLYSKKLALVTLALLGYGVTSDVLIQQLRAVGGAIETLLFGSLVLLLAIWLALSAKPRREQSMRLRLARLAAYLGWGLSAGLGLWTHFLVAPFVLAGGLILLLFCFRDLLSFAPLLLVLGFLLGFFPFIIYNIHASPEHNTLLTILNIHSSATIIPPNTQHLLRMRFVGTFLWSLPVATGLAPVCSLTSLPYYGPANSSTLPCILEMGGWSLGYMLLMGIAALLAIGGLWKLWTARRARQAAWTPEERAAVIINFSRLMILMCAVLTLLFYISSPLSALKPWSTRYLVGLLVALPAILWPLWSAMGFEKFELPSRARLLALANRAMLVVVANVILAGTVASFTAMPGVEADNQQQQALVQGLLSIGATRVYSGYWTGGYRLVFQSQERIISAVPPGLSEPGGNRYAAYVPVVKADPHAAYVFAANSPDALAFAKKIAHSQTKYRRYTFSIYVVYQPIVGSANGVKQH